jgi:hypothetical protein
LPPTLPQRPNGLPISRRERATQSMSKTNDLAREAVSCNAVFGGEPAKVARCAVARKLLVLIYTVVNNRRPFDPAYGKTAVGG